MKNKYKTLIISCWIVLIACFLIKILGGNWFEIICNNENFINICDWIDSNISKYILMGVFYVASTYLICLCIYNKKIFTTLYLIPFALVVYLTKIFIPILAVVLELFLLILLPLILEKFKNWKRVILLFSLLLLYQFISLITRNIGLTITRDLCTLEGLILQIDYYIMIALTYLYNNRKEQ